VVGLTDDNSKKKIRERTKMQDSQQQLHDHIRFTCSKGIMGKTSCRCNKKINVVRLSARRKLLGTDEYNPGDGGKGDEPWIVANVEDSSMWESKSLLDPFDRAVFYWDLARPYTEPMDEPFPHYADYMKGSLIFWSTRSKKKQEWWLKSCAILVQLFLGTILTR
jgi:hypothetical protein